MNTEELWKDIPGYPHFMASNIGRIKSVDRLVVIGGKYGVGPKRFKGRMCAISLNNHGYSQCCALSKTATVHKLVALAWMHRPSDKTQINHINGIKTDNRVENLEWVDAFENARHSRRVLGQCIGANNWRARLSDEDVLNIRTLKSFGATLTNLAKSYNQDISNIWSIVNRKSWRHI